MQNKLKGLFKGISAKELREKSKNKDPMVLIDVRNPDEYEEMRLGIGEKLIPLEMCIRDRYWG